MVWAQTVCLEWNVCCSCSCLSVRRVLHKTTSCVSVNMSLWSSQLLNFLSTFHPCELAHTCWMPSSKVLGIPIEKAVLWWPTKTGISQFQQVLVITVSASIYHSTLNSGPSVVSHSCFPDCVRILIRRFHFLSYITNRVEDEGLLVFHEISIHLKYSCPCDLYKCADVSVIDKVSGFLFCLQSFCFVFLVFRHLKILCINSWH